MKYQETNDYELLYLISENNEVAYNFIYEKYKPLIEKMATKLSRKYKYVGLEYEDLVQEGMYGLSEAIRQYNFKENNLFFTLAYLCIKREMQRLAIKTLRYKNMVLNIAYSLESEISNEGPLIEELLFSDKDLISSNLEQEERTLYILNLKYELKDIYMPVYELKINGFSNQSIAELLDLRYKDVDNYLRSIKNCLRKKAINDIEY
ncbi:MAG: sigma-70 family RNA polymerase sigma factor [Bacilli bacterium]